MSPASDTALANAVSAYATTLSGLLALALTTLMGAQPKRWLIAYLCVVVTGVATVWYHGFGETFWPGLADIGTNLLLAWALQVAVLGDFYTPTTRRRVAWLSGAVILTFIAWKVAVGPGSSSAFPVTLGSFGGFNVGEVLLIANSLLVVGLFYARRAVIPQNARPLLYLLTATFFAGLLLATASNHRVDLQVMAYHATWHIVAAFGFIELWAFNHVRFAQVTSARQTG
jgi:hypothetical protein